MTRILKIEYRRLTRWDLWNGGVKRAQGGIWTWAGHIGPVALFVWAGPR